MSWQGMSGQKGWGCRSGYNPGLDMVRNVKEAQETGSEELGYTTESRSQKELRGLGAGPCLHASASHYVRTLGYLSSLPLYHNKKLCIGGK